MSQAAANLQAAQQKALANRPKTGGFPVLAEILRAAGVTKNIWSLPSAQSIYLTKLGPVVQQGTPLVTGTHEIAKFDQEAFLQVLRKNQEGGNTFPEFLKGSWEAGVVGYTVDFEKRNVTYFGALGESYVEDYPAVTI